MHDSDGARRPLNEIKANLFKGLSHPARVRILELLVASTELSVAEVIESTGLEASLVSQHLSVLRRHNLVQSERRGTRVVYRLAYPEVADLLVVARALLVKILETTTSQLSSTIALAD
ncbi:putative HTH-type transcriptional regulator [Frondihabitans sp. 762G35]|uniref:ArsR/SmtB family transcription factor n=1 Tax=Frondihabitans sp. 762G35 TaxID=1446794 RepID=UPI000D2191DC|nr:metalloregulator ArsR/SmtB family transcription factor [Frondihabitans sp. 762G35]ARC58004.1 putative HTH-type transcriptional regulator [Frondihabitans sp. 762G35]